MTGITPYLHFDGQARAALEFYRDVFGGEIVLNTYGDFGRTDGPAEAIAQGRREAVLARRSVREFDPSPVPADDIRAALGEALTAPAPHHTHPVRFVWLRSADRRRRLLDAMARQWRDKPWQKQVISIGRLPLQLPLISAAWSIFKDPSMR